MLPSQNAARGIVPTRRATRHPPIAAGRPPTHGRGRWCDDAPCAGAGRSLSYPLRFAHADVAQLVEHNLAKVGVAGSNPVVRSIDHPPKAGTGRVREHRIRLSSLEGPDEGRTYGDVAKWQGRGLQSLYPRFESGRRLQLSTCGNAVSKDLDGTCTHGRAMHPLP